MKLFSATIATVLLTGAVTVPIGTVEARKRARSKNKNVIGTGWYLGQDMEDGTQQALHIVCNEDEYCDVILSDPSFQTCAALLGDIFVGIAIAKNVPQSSLDNFNLNLYCLEQGEQTIDLSGTPNATLKGDLVALPDGGVRRTGPGFLYFQTSNPNPPPPSTGGNSKSGKKGKKNSSSSSSSDITNGWYAGVDNVDGSNQKLDIVCDDDTDLCDINLDDASFSTCAQINGANFFRGIGVARDVPRDSLDDFDIKLYCLGPNELVVDIEDPNRIPDALLPGNFFRIQAGVLRRVGTGIDYILTSYAADPSSSSSSSRKLGKKKKNKNNMGLTASRYYGVDVEDGSSQGIDILCNDNDLCDVTLTDASFSTCINNIPGDIFLGGIAIARNVPRNKLDKFDLLLYCVDSFGAFPIDFTGPPSATLEGDLVFLDDGIVQRTGPKFTYFNAFTGDALDANQTGDGKGSKSGKKKKKKGSAALIENGKYAGSNLNEGGREIYDVLCIDGLCEVHLTNVIFTGCILPQNNFKPFFNGLGFVKDVPESSLDDFDMNIYCLPDDTPGSIVDINGPPTFTIKSDMVPIQPDGLVLLKDFNFILFKENP